MNEHPQVLLHVRQAVYHWATLLTPHPHLSSSRVPHKNTSAKDQASQRGASFVYVILASGILLSFSSLTFKKATGMWILRKLIKCECQFEPLFPQWGVF